jgi:hypothetical protein
MSNIKDCPTFHIMNFNTTQWHTHKNIQYAQFQMWLKIRWPNLLKEKTMGNFSFQKKRIVWHFKKLYITSRGWCKHCFYQICLSNLHLTMQTRSQKKKKNNIIIRRMHLELEWLVNQSLFLDLDHHIMVLHNWICSAKKICGRLQNSPIFFPQNFISPCMDFPFKLILHVTSLLEMVSHSIIQSHYHLTRHL